jgi:1D-myo-inositol-tetrakisphosphate 5-kinase/inositol-polyphosphate multikinase
MEEIGFLVLGMRVYHAHSDSYETQNQHYGRSLTKETIKDGKCEKNQWFYLLQLTK